MTEKFFFQNYQFDQFNYQFEKVFFFKIISYIELVT